MPGRSVGPWASPLPPFHLPLSFLLQGVKVSCRRPVHQYFSGFIQPFPLRYSRSPVSPPHSVPPLLPGPLARGLVACTGAQFCGVGLVETKNRALDLIERLEARYQLPHMVRLHFSGCPNSCGQSQVADIGLMGAPAKKDGKAVEGVDIFLGGAVGEGEGGRAGREGGREGCFQLDLGLAGEIPSRRKGDMTAAVRRRHRSY